MMRLLQGDVGSGKTAVAMLALLAAAGSGWQGALMAPTEVHTHTHTDTLTQTHARTHCFLVVQPTSVTKLVSVCRQHQHGVSW